MIDAAETDDEIFARAQDLFSNGPNDKEYRRIIQLLVERNYVLAFNGLAIIHWGNGADDQAIDLWRRGAERNDPWCLFNLADCYDKADVGTRNWAEAERLYKLVHQYGDSELKDLVAEAFLFEACSVLNRSNVGPEQRVKESNRLSDLAAEHGDAARRIHVAKSFIGIDDGRAIHWLARALEDPTLPVVEAQSCIKEIFALANNNPTLRQKLSTGLAGIFADAVSPATLPPNGIALAATPAPGPAAGMAG